MYFTLFLFIYYFLDDQIRIFLAPHLENFIGFSSFGETLKCISLLRNRDLARLAEKADYPAYGVTGPNPLYYSSTGPVSRLDMSKFY